jgi:uncharacterized protein
VLLLKLSAQGVLQHPDPAGHLIRQYEFRHGKRHDKQGNYRPPTEADAWRFSLPALASALVDAGLGAVEVLIEYDVPGYVVPGNGQPLPIDVVLCGVHPRTGEPSYAIVELKQWSSRATRE